MTQPTHELRFRPHAPLRGAHLADPRVPLPPLPEPEPEPVPLPVPVPVPEQAKREREGEREREPEPAPPPAPPAPANLWESEIGQALAEDRARIERALTALAAKVETLQESRRRDWRDWQRGAVELAVTLASRLLHDRLTAGDFPVESLVGELLGQVGGVGPVVVHLHPEDLALLQSRFGDRPLTEGQENLTIVPDPALGRGDCRVETGDAVALAQLPVQLEEARRRMLRSLGHAQG